MKIADIPIPQLSPSGKINVLFTAVGLTLPRAFQDCYLTLENLLTNVIKLDIKSILTDQAFSITGDVQFSLSSCNDSSALELMLAVADPILSHLNYHIVVGAAVGESRASLLSLSQSFDQKVKNYNAQPCLFVFAPTEYIIEDFPASATSLSSVSKQDDLFRIIKQGFLRCLMEYFHFLGPSATELLEKQDSISMIKLASYCYMFGGYSVSKNFLTKAAKVSKTPEASSLLVELSADPNLDFDVENSFLARDPLRPELKELELPEKLVSALVHSDKIKEKDHFRRVSARIIPLFPKFCRQLALAALDTTNNKSSKDIYFIYLFFLLLRHFHFDKTFIFRMSNILNQEAHLPDFLLREYINSLTSSSGWIRQQLKCTLDLFYSMKYPRDMQNTIISYLMKDLKNIPDPEEQKKVLSMVPSNFVVDASSLIEVHSVLLNDILSEIQPVSDQQRTYIYSPIVKKKVYSYCAVDDVLCFTVTFNNLMKLPFQMSVVCLEAENGIPTPAEASISPAESISFPLSIQPSSPGELKIKGISFVLGVIPAKYELENPIKMVVIDTLPTLIFRLPFKDDFSIFENSNQNLKFEIINPGDVALKFQEIQWATSPPLLTSTSLPISYPPTIDPKFPDFIEPKSSFSFFLRFLADKTLEVLSFSINYGNDMFTRQFDYNHNLEVEDGPVIKSLKVIKNDDDFLSDYFTLLLVINNPFKYPLFLSSCSKELSVLSTQTGCLMLTSKKIDVDISKITDVIDRDHVRRCESVEVTKNMKDLTKEEREDLRTCLLLKYHLQKQLDLTWRDDSNHRGVLAFTHVLLEKPTAMLLQKAPFSVEFEVQHVMEFIWKVTTTIGSSSSLKIQVQLVFEAQDPWNPVLAAGPSVYNVEAPNSFETFINLLPSTLSITGNCTLHGACFIRKWSQKLS